MNDKKYEEVGHVYRFFLGLRHATFAGNLVVLYGVMSLCISASKDAPNLIWVAPLVASPVGVLLWWIDVRTRDLYHAARKAGKDLEGKGGGLYTRLTEVTLPINSQIFKPKTHSGALDAFLLGSSLVLFVGGAVLLYQRVCS
jgi:hypothetical protein